MQRVIECESHLRSAEISSTQDLRLNYITGRSSEQASMQLKAKLFEEDKRKLVISICEQLIRHPGDILNVNEQVAPLGEPRRKMKHFCGPFTSNDIICQCSRYQQTTSIKKSVFS
jgi:hypothetical protein